MHSLCAAVLACATVAADGGEELRLSELIELIVGPAAVEAEKPGFSGDGAPEEMRLRLRKKVSFEFAETPLREALDFLAVLGGVTVVLLPEVAEEGTNPVTLAVEAMTLEHAFSWVARLAGIPARVEMGAVVFGPGKKTDLVIRVYDIRDFAPVTDFPGPDIVLGAAPEGPGLGFVGR